VLCDTWNCSDDNDTVSGVAILDTTAIPEKNALFWGGELDTLGEIPPRDVWIKPELFLPKVQTGTQTPRNSVITRPRRRVMTLLTVLNTSRQSKTIRGVYRQRGAPGAGAHPRWVATFFSSLKIAHVVQHASIYHSGRTFAMSLAVAV